MSEYTAEEYAAIKARGEARRVADAIRLGAVYGSGAGSLRENVVVANLKGYDGRVAEKHINEIRKFFGAKPIFWTEDRLRWLNSRITRHSALTGRRL